MGPLYPWFCCRVWRDVSEHGSETALTQCLSAFNVYDAMTTWPPALRQDLRTALKKKNKKDYDESESYFRRYAIPANVFL